MDLLLEIISHQRHTMTEPQSQFVFKAAGGTIGRSQKSDWLIDDPERLISGQHAAIHFETNQFIISDTSTNGLFVNHNQQPLAEQQHVVVNGDIFLLGQYSLQATLIATQSQAVFSSSHTQSEPAAALSSALPLYSGEANDLVHNLHQSVDPLSQFNDEPVAGRLAEQDILAQADPVNSILDPIPSTQAFFDLPDAIPENWLNNKQAEKYSENSHKVNESISDVIQENSLQNTAENLAINTPEPAPEPTVENAVGSFEDFQKDFQKELNSNAANEDPINPLSSPDTGDDKLSSPVVELAARSLPKKSLPKESIPKDSKPEESTIRTHQPAVQFTQTAADTNSVNHLLKNLGINPADVSAEQLPALLENIAHITRHSMQGIMQTMMSRAHLKSEFRLSMTTIQTEENNPLKFCINYEQLLHYMLLNPKSGVGAGYLDARQAVNDSFKEIQEHQIGVMAGMKAALKAMLKNLSPEKVIENAERFKSGSLALASKKSRYWDAYKHLYNDMNNEEEVFASAFGQEFCKAYESQIDQIRQAANKS